MDNAIEKTVNEIVKESFEAGRKHGVEEEKERIRKGFEDGKIIIRYTANGVTFEELSSEIVQAPEEKPVIDTPKIGSEEHNCPKCGKKYQYINSFRKHLKGHDYNEAEISQIELGGKQNAIPENK